MLPKMSGVLVEAGSGEGQLTVPSEAASQRVGHKTILLELHAEILERDGLEIPDWIIVAGISQS